MPVFTAWLLGICIMFLQMGFSYYVSFQSLAILVLGAALMRYKPVVLMQSSILLVMALFSVFLLFTALRVPVAISENSDNITYTTVGVIGYAAMILLAPNLAFESVEGVLRFFRFVSTMTIVISVALICVVDLSIIPLLSRETLLKQNATLVTNYSTKEALVKDLAYRHDNDLNLDIDLFYGEQSYLALVIFACVVSRIMCDAALRRVNQPAEGSLQPELPRGNRERKRAKSPLLARLDKQWLITAMGLGAMIYIHAFSSLFYVVIVVASLTWSLRRRLNRIRLDLTGLAAMVLVLGLLAKVGMSAYGYYAYRINSVSDSASFDQRFGIVFDFGLQDFIVGITSAAQMPTTGFNNGLLYIIGIAGMAGIMMVAYLCHRVYVLSRPFGLSAMTVLCVLGVFSQNGAIFSPNKVIILSLVLIPLACGNQKKLGRRALPFSGTQAPPTHATVLQSK